MLTRERLLFGKQARGMDNRASSEAFGGVNEAESWAVMYEIASGLLGCGWVSTVQGLGVGTRNVPLS